MAKQVGIEVEQRNTEEQWDIAYKRRVVSVVVSRKKKVAIDAIKSVANGVFPSYISIKLDFCSLCEPSEPSEPSEFPKTFLQS